MKKRFDHLCVIIFSFIFLSSVLASAITGSMGNARMVLYPEVNGWTYTTLEKSILVKNVNNVPINIKLVADEEGEKFLDVIDKEFVLQAGENKKAGFIVKVKKEGTYEGKINVFFSPSDNESKEPSVVLSSTIIAIAKKAGEYNDAEIDECEDDNCDLDNNGISVGTGGVVGVDGNKKPIGAILLSISSFILLIILISLIFVILKKKSLKKGEKRGGKLNEGKKR